MRLFTAILFPDAEKDAVVQRQTLLRGRAACGNFSRRENLHLTLIFLGDVAPSGLAGIRRCMDAAAGPAFDFALGGFGRFRGRDGDTWWLSVRAPQELADLYERLRSDLAAAGYAAEARPYAPHLTIGREVRLRAGETGAGPVLPDIRCRASAVSLMRSDRTNGVLAYTELYRKELQHGGRS